MDNFNKETKSPSSFGRERSFGRRPFQDRGRSFDRPRFPRKSSESKEAPADGNYNKVSIPEGSNRNFNRQPFSSSRPASAAPRRQFGSDERRPRPSFSQQKPSFGGEGSSFNHARPSRPAFGASRPSFEGDSRSSFGSRRPSFEGGSRPSFGSGRPSFSSDRPRFGNGGGRDSRGGRSFGGGGRFNRGGQGGRGNARRVHMDESRFIMKAKPKTEETKYVPENKFTEFGLSKSLEKNILAKGFETPTPIQDKSINHIIQGKDIVGIANTGTGKTGAFLIPLIEKIARGHEHKILILTPTRELAEQINDEFYQLTRGMRVFSVSCIGGESIYRQMGNLRRGYNFIIGTPGRIKDLHKREAIDLSAFKTIVLDEVDRMLDMGFIDDIKHLVSQLPEERQSLFFSATVDNRVEGLIKPIIKPEFARVAVSVPQAAETVEQDVVYFKDYEDKLALLKELLKSEGFDKTLVFANTKREVDILDKMLFKEGYQVESIHGDRRQRERKRAVDKFRAGRVNVLIATDVAARGLDISGVTHVINYDIPNNHEDYIHRIGRTGRANKSGNALTFVKKRESYGR